MNSGAASLNQGAGAKRGRAPVPGWQDAVVMAAAMATLMQVLVLFPLEPSGELEDEVPKRMGWTVFDRNN